MIKIRLPRSFVLALTGIVTLFSLQPAKASNNKGILLQATSINLTVPEDAKIDDLDILEIYLGLNTAETQAGYKVAHSYRQLLLQTTEIERKMSLPLNRSFYLPTEALYSGICIDARINKKETGYLGTACTSLSDNGFSPLESLQTIQFEFVSGVVLQMTLRAYSVELRSSSEEMEEGSLGVLFHFFMLQTQQSKSWHNRATPFALRYEVSNKNGKLIARFGDAVFWTNPFWIPPQAHPFLTQLPEERDLFTNLDDVVVFDAMPQEMTIAIEELRSYVILWKSLVPGHQWIHIPLPCHLSQWNLGSSQTLENNLGYVLSVDFYQIKRDDDSRR